MNKKISIIVKILCMGGALSAPVMNASAAGSPNWLEVRVSDRNTGKPVENAAVCLGTTARNDQFGALRSDAAGVVRFDDVVSNSMLVTVSKKGFQGKQQLLGPMHQSRVLMLKVASGGGGPECDAPLREAVDPAASGLAITSVSVRQDPAVAGNVLVTLRVSGQANQVRISERADFKGAEWQAYQSPLSVTSSGGKGVKRLYAQVRRHAQSQGASMQVVSPVVSRDYRVD